MVELKQRLSSGDLADWLEALRDFKPKNFDGDPMQLPPIERARVAIKAARRAGWVVGAKPTDEQLHDMSYAEVMDLADTVTELFLKWHSREIVDGEEKNA